MSTLIIIPRDSSHMVDKTNRSRVASDCAAVSVSIERPAIAAPYAAGDVIGAADPRGAPVASTITTATPAVVTPAAGVFADGDAVMLSTTGALPTGLSANTMYFVVSAGADTFSLSATLGGAAIATTVNGSGTHYVVRLGSAIWELPGLAAGGDMVTIREASLRIDAAAVPSGMSSFRLHLYNIPPPSALVDNAAWDLPAGDRAAYLGYIDLGYPADMGSTLYVQNSAINKDVPALSGSLYGYLVTAGGYTPAASTSKTLKLSAISI